MNQQQMQDLVAGMSARLQTARADSQLTLGGLISALEAMSGESQVCDLRDAHSYRGYYCDLAFELGSGPTRPARDLLAECRSAMGRVFEGYKGGDFLMGATTPLWVAEYGKSGVRLLAMHSDGTIETAADVE